jgi:hypothetical protein
MAVAAAGMMMAGGILQSQAIQQQGHAAKEAADFNARVARQNAKIARQQAAEDERKFRYNVGKQFGETRASIGASNLQLDGSVLDVLEDSTTQAMNDAMEIRYAGELKALGFNQEAELQTKQGKAALAGAGWGSAAALLGAGGQAMSFYGKK